MSDHKHFNCSEQYEHDYIVRQYKDTQRPKVRELLKKRCGDGTINYSTHNEVYELIEKELGYKQER